MGPLRAARNIAGKLHIDRKNTRTPPPATASAQTTAAGPEIQVRSATPQSSLDTTTSPTSPQHPMAPAAESLSAARSELAERNGISTSSEVPDVPAIPTPRPPIIQTGSARSGRSSGSSRPTTPRSEGRLSNSSSLKSIHEALEPSSISPPLEDSASQGKEKPLPALPSQ